MFMHRPLFRVARVIYRAIPFQPLRQAAFSVYARVVRHRVVTAAVDGAQYELHLGEMIDLALYLQQFEPDVRTAIRRLTAPGMTVLDIGANVGAHTLLFSSLVGGTGRVVAFEPTEFAFAKLRKNAALNPELPVEIVRTALADHTSPQQEADFRASWQSDGTRVNGLSTVDFVRLDDWAAQHALSRVDLIKLDVDGYEYPVIAGGLDTIARSRPTFIIEATGLHFADPARNPFEVLRSLRYGFWDIEGREQIGLDTLRTRLPADDQSFSINLIARPE
jgi:FkbM family methyltransferase